MALSNSTFSDFAGAASDLFAGFSATTQADLKAKGLNISAEGLRLKAQGDLAEAENYDLASGLALKNVQFAKTSTEIQEAQQDRATYLQIGGQKAAIGGAGFAESGSSLDILADSARQGALAKAVLGEQGLINEAGYQEQSDSFNVMAAAARTDAAGQMKIADETDQLAKDTIEAGKQAATGDFITSAIKGIAGIASIGFAPMTGGLSLAGLTGLFTGSSGGGGTAP